jgi:CheY-like chemotaxis protein/HPt (histidine-containing phosphotransfer) domain-containing protein
MELPDFAGLDFARSLRNQPELSRTSLLLMASGSNHGDTTVLRATGVAAILPKPIRQKQFVESLNRLLSHTQQHETRFWLDRRPPPEEKGSLKQQIGARNLHVLVAEDNPINQRVAIALLEKIGFQAQAVATGAEALRALDTVAYDIILMDVQLPELDGFATTKEIRLRESQQEGDAKQPIYIIAMTAFAVRGAREQCLAAGMDDYISKPVRIEALMRVIQKALGKLAPPDTIPPSEEPISVPTDAVDPSALEALRALQQPGRPDPAAEMVEMFLQEAPASLHDMGTAITRYEAEKVEHAAHSLKGAASSIGAKRLAELCDSMEQEANKGSIQVASHLLNQARLEFSRVRDQLQALSSS